MTEPDPISRELSVEESLETMQRAGVVGPAFDIIKARLGELEGALEERDRANYFIDNMGDLFVGKPEVDALRTRLAEVEQRARLAVHAAEQVKNPEFVKALDEAGVEYVEQLVERIAEVERDRDEAREFSIGETWELEKARSQLTQAREALEAIDYEVRVMEQEDHLPDVKCVGASFHLAKVAELARQALATINEGEAG